MAFIRKKDFDRRISRDKLEEIATSYDVNLEEAQSDAIGEFKAYVRHRFDISQLLPDIVEYSDAAAYTAGSTPISYPHEDGDIYTVLTDTAAGESPDTDPAKWSKADPRDAYAIGFILDLCLFKIFSLVNPRQVQEHRVDRYDRAIMELEKIRSGKLTPNWAEVDAAAKTGYPIQWGSTQTKQTNTY